jgi:hypothetical protein
MTDVIPALEAETAVRMWRFALNKVPGSSPGNDGVIKNRIAVIPALEAGTSVRMWHRGIASG